jgi:hypothetical protein
VVAHRLQQADQGLDVVARQRLEEQVLDDLDVPRGTRCPASVIVTVMPRSSSAAWVRVTRPAFSSRPAW